VIGEEGAKLLGPMGQRQEHVGNEARFVLDGVNRFSYVVGESDDIGYGKAAYGLVTHWELLPLLELGRAPPV